MIRNSTSNCVFEVGRTLFVFAHVFEALLTGVVQSKPMGKKTVTESGWTLSAYCACKKCCGKEDGIATSGTQLSNADIKQVCAAPSKFSFGTTIKISGGWNGTVTVEDRGGAIKGKRLDIFMGMKEKHDDAIAFGKKQNCTIEYEVDE